MTLPAHDLVVVSGTASVDVRPDTVSFNVGVETDGHEVREVVRENTRKVAKIVAALKQHGVNPEELRTSTIHLTSREKQEKKVSYRIATEIGVTRKSATEAGELMSVAVEAGANEIHGPEFSVSDEKSVQNRCIELAFNDAREKAQKLATLSERTLGKVLAVTDGSSSPFEFKYRTPGVEGGALGGFLVESGTRTIQCGVTIAFQLR